MKKRRVIKKVSLFIVILMLSMTLDKINVGAPSDFDQKMEIYSEYLQTSPATTETLTTFSHSTSTADMPNDIIPTAVRAIVLIALIPAALNHVLFIS